MIFYGFNRSVWPLDVDTVILQEVLSDIKTPIGCVFRRVFEPRAQPNMAVNISEIRLRHIERCKITRLPGC